MNYDLVVVGGGSAGMMGAVTAAQHGVKRIALLEKGAALGGNSMMAGTIFSTAFKGWGSYEDDKNVNILFHTVMEELHWMGNPRLIGRYLRRVKDVARFFEARDVKWEFLAGGKFGINGCMNVESYEPTGLGPVLCRILKDELKKYPNIEVYTRCPARHLLTDEQGRVCGVEAEQEGAEKTFSSRYVIISTGGAAGSKESIAKYVPWCINQPDDEIRTKGYPTCVGDGIEMCGEIGADTSRGVNIHLLPPWLGGRESTRLGMLLQHPAALLIAADGQRLMDESERFDEVLDLVNQKPRKTCYALYDTPGMHRIWDDTNHPPRDLKNNAIRFYDGINFDTPFESMEKDFAIDFKRKDVQKFDTLDQVAAAVGASLEVLKATVEEYNRAVSDGYDPLMGKSAEYLTCQVKDGPFYLLTGRRSVDSTQGGVAVNEYLQPVRKDGSAIPGIFVCGDPVSGFVSEHYYAPGGAGFTFALTSGMMAGEDTAEALAE